MTALVEPLLSVLQINALANGARWDWKGRCNFIRVIEATAAFKLRIAAGSESTFRKGQSFRAPLGSFIEQLQVLNDSGAANTITLALAIGEVSDDRVILEAGTAISLAAAGSIATAADVVLAAAVAAQLVPANLNRKAVALKNVGAAVMRVGDQGNVAAARGHELQPGETIVLNTTARVDGFSTAGTTVSALEEIA